MGGVLFLAARAALLSFALLALDGSLFLKSAAAEDTSSSGSQEIDITNPPEHLKKTALIDLLQKRQLTKFPSQVEDVVKQMIYSDASPIRAFVPRGRSAQSASTDEFNPRILITSHSANKLAGRYPIGFEDYTAFPGSDYEGRLYFGFATATQQGESLSWNRITHQFDYFIITGVGAARNPKIFEVTARESCTKCHQNQAPIFALPPWSEIITHDPTEPKKLPLLQAFPSDPVTYLKNGVLITAETTPIANNTGLASDSASGAGNRLVQASRIIQQACKDDLNCRRFILMAAMSNPNQSSYLRKNFVKKSDTGNDAVDIDFVQGPLNNLQALITAGTIPAYLNNFQNILTPKWPGDNFAFIAQLLPDPTTLSTAALQYAGDPLTPRGPLLPLPSNLGTAYFYDIAFEALGFNLQDTLRFQAIPLAARMRALGSEAEYIPRAVMPLLVNWPPTREDILAFYRIPDNASSVPIVTTDADHDNTPGTVPVSTPLTSVRAVAGNAAAGSVANFQKYCVSCHNDPNGENPYINFNDPNALLQFNTGKAQTVERRLSRSSMPPSNAAQPSAAERSAMLAFFNAAGGAPTTQPVGTIANSYLGLRIQNVRGIKASYVGGTANTAITAEGYSVDCGQTFSPTNQNNPGALLAAQTADDKIYLSLENFPNYFIGNITEVTAYNPSPERCYPLAVSRNGSLLRLGWNNLRGAFGAVPLKVAAGSPAVALLHVASRDMRILATGRDGNLYQVHYPSGGKDSYSLELITPIGLPNAKWLRVGFKGSAGSTKIIAETIEGRRVSFNTREDEDRQLDMRWESGDRTIVTNDFVPNLLDRDSVILNPIGSTER